MKPALKILSGATILLIVGLVFLQPVSNLVPTTQSRTAGANLPGESISQVDVDVHVGEPSVPTISPAVRDLPPYQPDLPLLDREMKPRDDHGFTGPDIQGRPWNNPLVQVQANARPSAPDAFGTPILNFAGVQSSSSPPDDTGDVGPNYFVQADNGPGGSRVTIFDKTGVQQAQFNMEDLASTAPCNSGYCDPIVQYDEMAERWMISEFDSSAQTLCVYVSTTPDPLGTWYAYSFNPDGGMQDYPKYAVWPDGYYIGVNNGGYIHVLDRVSMINGAPATSQSFNIGTLPGFGFQLTLPATLEGNAPPAGSPAVFMQPRDTEVHGGTCPGCDLMEMWAFHVDWATPANSSVTQLPDVPIAEFDHTLCGTGSDWSCMPQPGTSQKLDPIREPVHFPLQYRNFGSHEVLVGCFVEDVDGTDHTAVHWFELRKDTGDWYSYQEGVLGGEPNVHRGVCSAAMDSSGNIAVGYTRTGDNVPYYPSIYYSGRLASDPLGTMPYYDNVIWDATNSNTDNERWGDYSGIGVDPADGCTFWFTTEYGGNGQTRIASFKFDACGTADFTLSADPNSFEVCTPQSVTSAIQVGEVATYTHDVTLEVLDLPAGVTAEIVPPVVTPPGEATLTLDVSDTAVEGTYTLIVAGTAEMTNTHTVEIELLVNAGAPDAAVLLDPADGATDTPYSNLTFTWEPLPLVQNYSLQIDTDPNFSAPLVDLTGIPSSQYTLDDPLAPTTTYYWRVMGANACGDGQWSTPFSFQTRASACVLLVDDDGNGPDVQSYYTDVLDALELDYELWDTSVSNDPSFGDLANHNMVFWFTGYPWGSTFTGANEAAVADYLDAGGNLFLSSEDYLYDFGLTSFGQNYLHIGSFSNDENKTDVMGNVGDPVGDGLGPYNLTAPAGWSTLYTDYVDNDSSPGANSPFRWQSVGQNSSISYDGQTFKTVFFGWPLEGIAALDGRTEIIAAMSDFFGGCAPQEPAIQVTPDAFAVTLPLWDMTTEWMTISNTGGLELEFAIDESPQVDWLSVTPTAGSLSSGASLPVQLDFDANELVPGTYTADLEIVHNGSNPSPVIVPIELTVQDCQATLLVDPPQVEAFANGTPFDVSIVISDVADLGGFEFDMVYDPAVVQVISVTLGAFPGSTGRTWFELGPEIDNLNGRVSYGAGSFGAQPGPDGTGVIAIITLVPQDEGMTTLDLQLGQAADTAGQPIEPLCQQDGLAIVSGCFRYDFDCDCDVDIVDIMAVAARWQCELGEPCYNPLYDVDDDGDIDIVDIMQTASQWGWSCP